MFMKRIIEARVVIKKQSERNEGKCFHGIKSKIKILTGVLLT